jgi:NADH dehydrogenase [ubiquinone] 1 alpha subcomplex assembly factor 7
MSLADRLAAEIAATGPISVAHFMTACLHDPMDGYYATRPALGAAGDFITAPLISQMFGELVGVWAQAAWLAMGSPPKVLVVEMGPGDGTLMADLLRATAKAADFRAAAQVWLVETSGPLQALQHERLGEDVRWAKSLAEVPDNAPMILVANELLDCLPARQFVRTAVSWREQVIGLDADGRLAFGLAGTAAEALLPDAPAGAVYEQSAAQAALGAEIGERLVRDGGAALMIDYGRDVPGFGDTLQALSQHRKVDPLATAGRADLTIHADFPAVMDAAEQAGARSAILTQSQFLARLGIGARAEALVRNRPDMTAAIGRQLHRLVGDDEMGELFKACCLYSPGWTPPGFEDA